MFAHLPCCFFKACKKSIGHLEAYWMKHVVEKTRKGTTPTTTTAFWAQLVLCHSFVHGKVCFCKMESYWISQSMQQLSSKNDTKWSNCIFALVCDWSLFILFIPQGSSTDAGTALKHNQVCWWDDGDQSAWKHRVSCEYYEIVRYESVC